MALPTLLQVSLVDRPAANPSRRNANYNRGSRYSPHNKPRTLKAHFPELIRGSDGRAWLRLRHDQGAYGGTSRQDYAWPNISGPGMQRIDARPRSIALEFEFSIADSANADTLNLWNLRGSISGVPTEVLLRQRAQKTVARATRSGVITDTPLTGIPHLALDRIYSARLLAWASKEGESNGRLALWLAPGSITDRRILGGRDLAWTTALVMEDLDADVFDGLEFQYNPTSPAVTVGPNPSLWVRCLWQGSPDATPTHPMDGSTSWFDLHQNTIERSGIEWAGTSFSLRSTCIVHEGVTPCAAQANTQLRLYSSFAAYQADAPSSVGVSKAVPERLGYRRDTGKVDGLSPETFYVYEWRLLLRDHAFNGGHQYVVRGKPGCFFTPPAPGRAFSTPPYIEISACRHQDYHANCAKRHRGLEGWPDNRFRLLIEEGDDVGGGYMDEVKFEKAMDLDGDGIAESFGKYTSAETLQQMADEAATLAHSFESLEESRYWVKDTLGDDHNRGANDTAIMDMLAEDRTWADGVQVCPWKRRGASVINPRYGFPNSIEWYTDIEEGVNPDYSQTPRKVADNLLAHFKSWGLDIAPRVGETRMDVSMIEKYPSARFASDDAGYYYKDYGPIRLVVCDTRLSMTRDPARGGPRFFNWAKHWVINAIRDAPGPGILLAIPGYVQGYAQGAVHKRNDCIAAYIQDGNAVVEDEALQVFHDAMELAGIVIWGVVVVGDAHWASLDSTVGNGFSPKWIAQIHDAGSQSIVQDWHEMGDVENQEDYVYLTNFGLTEGGIRTRTRYKLLDGSTGRGQVTLWRIGADQVIEHQVVI